MNIKTKKSNFLLLFKYSCLRFPTITFAHLIHPYIPPSILLPPLVCPWLLHTCSLTSLPLLSPIIPLLPPLWVLSGCSVFQCLWLYFACLFVKEISQKHRHAHTHRQAHTDTRTEPNHTIVYVLSLVEKIALCRGPEYLGPTEPATCLSLYFSLRGGAVYKHLGAFNS